MNTVEAERVGKLFRRSEIVNRDNVVMLLQLCDSHYGPANATESVDRNFCFHDLLSSGGL